MNKIPGYIKDIMDAEPNIGRDKLSEMCDISNQEARFYCKLYKFSENKPIMRGIAVGDMHYPYQNQEAMNILLEFTKDFQPDYFLLMGDQMDMDSISYYNSNKPKLTEGKRLKREYKGFQHKVLNPLDIILDDQCKRYFFIGNHEYRVDRLIESSPQYEGFIEVESNLDLEKYRVIPFNDTINIGEMYFLHGVYWNKYHAEKNARIYGKHVFNWHVHTNQVYTMHSPINRLPRQGVSVGCMCDKNPDWMRGKPNAWVNQFMYFYLFGNGSFMYYTPIILNGRAMINDKLYVG